MEHQLTGIGVDKVTVGFKMDNTSWLRNILKPAGGKIFFVSLHL